MPLESGLRRPFYYPFFDLLVKVTRCDARLCDFTHKMQCLGHDLRSRPDLLEFSLRLQLYQRGVLFGRRGPSAGVVHGIANRRADGLDALVAVDADQKALLLVVSEEVRGLLLVHLQPVQHGLGFVVLTLVEFASALVASALDLGSEMVDM